MIHGQRKQFPAKETGISSRRLCTDDGIVTSAQELRIPEFLVPGMEHAEEADLGSEMGGVARDFE